MEVRSGAVTCVSLSDPQSHCGGWRNQNFRASQVSCIDNSTLLHLFKLLCSCRFSFSWERIYLTRKAFHHLVFFSYQNFHGTDHLFPCFFLVPKIWHQIFFPVFQTGLYSVESAIVKNFNFPFLVGENVKSRTVSMVGTYCHLPFLEVCPQGWLLPD